MRRPTKILHATIAVATCFVLTLAACNRDRGDSSDHTAVSNGDAPLPRPETGSGSVTGMPDRPGPGDVGPPPTPSDVVLRPDTSVASDGSTGLPPIAGTPGGTQPPNPGVDALVTEPTPDDAVEVVRDYYSAIDAHDYAHAWALWSDRGSASNQTLQQFADGFANTAHVGVQTGAPGRVEGAAGSRYIQVPISIEATLRDESTVQYIGTYTLRRAVVDGATADQRNWRIASADLREVKP